MLVTRAVDELALHEPNIRGPEDTASRVVGNHSGGWEFGQTNDAIKVPNRGRITRTVRDDVGQDSDWGRIGGEVEVLLPKWGQ